jgi:hypothetical protein
MLRSNRGKCQAHAGLRKQAGGLREALSAGDQLQGNALVLSYYGSWDVGTVATERSGGLSSAMWEEVYPGAKRINGERARPLARYAYST